MLLTKKTLFSQIQQKQTSLQLLKNTSYPKFLKHNL